MSDAEPGIRRQRTANGFRHLNSHGGVIRDRSTLTRIRSLAVPPAWEDVWICATPRGHIQATGRDARGRKQYRYHPSWREHRDGQKFQHMLEFARALPRLRRRCRSDLRCRRVTREVVLSALVLLLDETLIRVGNDEYARQNSSFGLTTMRDSHAHVDHRTVRFRFRGKAGREHLITLRDERLARVVRRCQELPGQHLFTYVDENDVVQRVHSQDVNEHIRNITGGDFSAKDFRTWAATVLTAAALEEISACDTATASQHNVVAAIARVAARLGNTPAICRRCYVHPELIEAYLDGTMAAALEAAAARGRRRTSGRELAPMEIAVLALLRRRLAGERRRRAA